MNTRFKRLLLVTVCAALALGTSAFAATGDVVLSEMFGVGINVPNGHGLRLTSGIAATSGLGVAVNQHGLRLVIGPAALAGNIAVRNSVDEWSLYE